MDTSPNTIKPQSADPKGSQVTPSPAAPKKVGINPLIFFVLSGVGFVLAAVVFAFFTKTPANKPASKPAVVPVSVETQVVSPAPSLSANESVSAPKEEKPLPSLSLSGILFSSGQSLALINGKVVPEGSTVEGAKVEKISTDTVELSFEGKKIILRSR